jgi:hypothetical protein
MGMNSALSRIFIFIVLLFGAVSAGAQDFPMLHFNVEEGLPSNVVYQVYKDSKGYIWIATDKGIARYNGIKFEVFTTANGLPDNEIFFFQEDLYGRLWLGTFNGERCFYKDGVFHTTANTPFLKLPFSTSHTVFIKVQKDSSVSLYYTGTLVNYDYEKSWVDQNNQLPKWFFQKIGKDRFNVFSDSFLVVTDRAGHVYQKTRLIQPFEKLYLCRNDYYFQFGRKVYNENRELITTIPDSILKNESYINSFGIFERDTFCFTKDGLYLNNSLKLLSGESVSSIAIDGDHNYWVSTLKNGIYVLPSYYLKARS